MITIRKLVQGVHMGLGHDGLRALLKREGIDLARLREGDLVMLMNKAGDKLKIIEGKGVLIAYLRMPKGIKIMKEAIQYIPTCFGGRGFDYEKACQKALETRLNSVKVPLSPLQKAKLEQQAIHGN